MRKLLVSGLLAAGLIAAPAAAGTLEAVVKHGIVLVIQGMEIEVAYTPDGKFTAMDGQVTGTWKIDGDKMCTSSNVDPNETCVAYPAGKGPGDEFELTSDQGTATIRIKK